MVFTRRPAPEPDPHRLGFNAAQCAAADVYDLLHRLGKKIPVDSRAGRPSLFLRCEFRRPARQSPFPQDPAIGAHGPGQFPPRARRPADVL